MFSSPRVTFFPEKRVMARTIPTVSMADSVAFNLCQIMPYYLRGLFTKNKFWISFWNKVHPALAAPLGAIPAQGLMLQAA